MKTMDELLAALRAVAEPTRLRLAVLSARGGELTVSELTQILGQSQPRVSRHLKLLCEAGVLERFREGSWVFYRLVRTGPVAGLVSGLATDCDDADATLALDLQRLAATKEQRAAQAAAYFRANAAQWHRIRALYVDEREVEAALVEVLDPRVGQALGIDLSREMLALARVNLERAGLANARVRRGDMYQLALADGSFDAVVIHQVLHHADRPVAAIAEAARVLRPRGLLVVVDFAPHNLEFLRAEHAHRRLGFADDEIVDWCRNAGLEPARPRLLPGDPLTVVIWTAARAAQPAGWRARVAAGEDEPALPALEGRIG